MEWWDRIMDTPMNQLRGWQVLAAVLIVVGFLTIAIGVSKAIQRLADLVAGRIRTRRTRRDRRVTWTP